MSQHRIVGDQVWCPVCSEYTQLLRIHNAARLVDVNRRTIYRYIEEGIVHAVNAAGKIIPRLQRLLAKARQLIRKVPDKKG